MEENLKKLIDKICKLLKRACEEENLKRAGVE